MSCHCKKCGLRYSSYCMTCEYWAVGIGIAKEK